MITRRFQNTLDELEGLIKDEIWSAPYAHEFADCSPVRALLAVSGGMDSMCLADLYDRICGPGGFDMAHCNFNLRGEESDADEAMVREWAASRGIRCHFMSFDTKAFAEMNGVSIEMAARELRYTWFAQLCREHGYAYVAVAHHADDNAETMILNLVRGTGMRGLCGMKQLSQLPYSLDDEHLRLMRPLLGFTRRQIEGYVFGHSLPYRNDSTNASVEYRRNSVRHEVFPVFERMNPSFVRTFNEEMRYFSDAEEIVSEWCGKVAESVVEYESEETAVIDTAELLSHRQWRYVLYHILEPLGFRSATLTSLEDLLSSGRTVSGKKFTSEHFALVTERGRLRVMPLAALEGDRDFEVTVAEPGLYRVGDVNIVVEKCPWTSEMSLRQPAGVLAFDAERLNFPFICRSWRRGDWMVPFGMRGKKKLSDIFADMKWHETEKKSAVVIVPATEEAENMQRVAALLGVRMDDRFRISNDTRMIIRVRKQ